MQTSKICFFLHEARTDMSCAITIHRSLIEVGFDEIVCSPLKERQKIGILLRGAVPSPLRRFLGSFLGRFLRDLFSVIVFLP